MPTTTTTYSFNKPVVGADEDDWGGYLNGNWDSVDDLLDGTTPVTGIDINSGTLDGVTIGGTTAGAGTFTNLTATGTTTLAGASTSADITFGDNDKAIFGAGSDLQIYHDGTNSFIDEAGTGNLRIRASSALNLQTRNTADTAWVNSIIADDGAGVRLFTNGSKKLETTSTGVDITGTLTSDGLTVDAANNSGITIDALSNNGSILFTGPTSTNGYRFNFNDPNETFAIDKITSGGSFSSTLFKIDINGDISFYEDTGTTAKFFWDASAESLGIGTTPNQSLVVADATGTTTVVIDNLRSNVGDVSSIIFRHNAITGSQIKSEALEDFSVSANRTSDLQFWTRNNGTILEAMRIDSSGNVGIGTTSPSQKLEVSDTAVQNVVLRVTNNDGNAEMQKYQDDLYLNLNDTGNIIVRSGSPIAERMRIDSSGNLLVGTTSTNPHNPSQGQGIALRSDGRVLSSVTGVSALFNRNSSDGDIVEFRKDGATVGSIGNNSSDLEIYAPNQSGIALKGNNVTPMYQSNQSDNQTDLGRSANRWRDLYLSGGVSNPSGSLTFDTTGGEAMRIDSSGNLLVGHTDRNTIVSDGTSGALLGYDGFIGASRLGSLGEVMVLNREDSDGSILSFRKDGSTVGSIRTISGDSIGVGTGVAGLRFVSGTNRIQPVNMTNGLNSDGLTDLGDTNKRFQDLYLSGGVYLGGTGSANKLDDYEEGTFTPTFVGSTGGTVTLGSAFDTYAYTKIGRIVTITGRVDVSGTPSLSGNLLLQGLPFTSGNLTDQAGYTVQYGFITIGASNTGNPIVIELQEGTTEAALRLEDWTTASGVLVNNSRIQMSITYFTS